MLPNTILDQYMYFYLTLTEGFGSKPISDPKLLALFVFFLFVLKTVYFKLKLGVFDLHL